MIRTNKNERAEYATDEARCWSMAESPSLGLKPTFMNASSTNAHSLDADQRRIPSNVRNDGNEELIRFITGQCSLGAILVAVSRAKIRAILLGETPVALIRELQHRFPDSHMDARDLQMTLDQVIAFIETPQLGLSLPLDPRGTVFQEKVWQALQEIPVGSTASYSEIAERIGEPNEAYAVGEACAANLIAVAIPCHRVVSKDKRLAGYRWGLERKRALLAREAKEFTLEVTP